MHRLFVLLLSLTLAAHTACAQAPDRPVNVIVMLIDDAGYNDFGFLGETQLRTPHMDQLAADGVNFRQGYVSASVCCPSRGGLLTGRYQQRFGHEYNGPREAVAPYHEAEAGLAVTEYTIGDVFQAYGYRTQCVGKWHMGGNQQAMQYDPLVRGFNEFYGLQAGHRHFFSHPQYERDQRDGFRMRDGWDYIPESDITYLTDNQSDAAVDFIRRHADQPFFIYLSYTAVHAPVEAKAEDIALFGHIDNQRRRTYAAMMKATDDSVGNIRATLEELGLTENTLIILTNDNGGPNSNGSSNFPLRGHKGSHWEGGLRVPFVMAMPGTVPAGVEYDHPVITLDILPTAMAVAGIEDPFHRARTLDGVNLMPFVLGENDARPHDRLFWRRGPRATVRDGDWKLIREEGQPLFLVNVVEDIRETTNVAEQHADRVQAMLELLEGWESELAPPRWLNRGRWVNVDTPEDAFPENWVALALQD